MNDAASSRWSRREWLLGLLLVAATLAVYQPAWHGGPIYDDVDHLTPPALRSVAGLARIWTELGVVSQYYPVTHTVFWLEHRMWGDAMLGYHLTNIVLHGVAALLLVRLLQTLRVRGSWLAGAVFALHPIMVESVAWVSELKNTLSGAFCFGAALAYLRYDRDRRIKWSLLALALFVAGLLSKGVIATLPAALLVIAWWRRGSISWRGDIVPLVPFFAVGIVLALLTAAVERAFIGAEGTAFNFTLGERTVIAGRAIGFYLGHLFWPFHPVFIYPRWSLHDAPAWQYLWPAAAIGLLAALWFQRARWPGALAAALLFVGTLVPVLGFLNVYPFRYSFVADHFAYLPSVSIIALGCAAGTSLLPRLEAGSAAIGRGAGVAVLTILAVTSWRLAHLYRDDETLWRATIARNPSAAIAYNNLSVDLTDRGQAAEAARMAEQAIALQPDYPEAHNNLGNALRRLGRDEDALKEYRRTIALRRDLANVHCNVGYILQDRGQIDAAIGCYRQAIEVRPRYARGHIDLASALLEKGQADEAIEHLRAGLALVPGDAEAHRLFGAALAQKGDLDAAIVHFRTALDAKNDDATVHADLGTALLRQGRTDEAIAEYRRALTLQPKFAFAQYNLACALLEKGDQAQAIASLEKTLAIEPDHVLAHFQLGNVFAATGRFDAAIAEFTKAAQLDPNFAEARAGLAAALEQKNRGTQR